MKNTEKLIRIYTGRQVTVTRIKAELDALGISYTTRNEFQQGLEAGFANGIPGEIDLFVQVKDARKVQEVISKLYD